MLSAEVDDPTGYGRVVRGKDDRVVRIVEERDADDEERQITEINTSIYCFRRSVLAPALRRTSPENAQGEYYLTDVVEVLADAGYPVASLVVDDAEEAGGDQRPGCSWPPPRPCSAAAPPTAGCGPGVTMVDPERIYARHHGRASARTSPSSPARCCRARPSSATTPRSAPTPASSTASSGPTPALEQVVGRDAEIGDDAVVGPYAVLEPGLADPSGARTGAVLHCRSSRRRRALRGRP